MHSWLLLCCSLMLMVGTSTARAQSVAPPATIPAPVATVASSPSSAPIRGEARTEMWREVLQNEADMRRILADRPRLTLPIILLATGAAGLGLTGLIGLSWWVDHDQQRYGFRPNGDRYTYNDPQDHRDVLKISAAAMVSGAIAIAGGVLLALRIKQRASISRELRPLQRRHQKLFDTLRASIDVGPHGAVGSAKVAF
jgi:hypothetical protein